MSSTAGKPVEPVTLLERVSAFYSYTAGSHAFASRQFSREEFDLVDAAQAEIALQTAPKTKQKSRQELEVLDEKIAGLGSSPVEDFLAHITRLVDKYKIQMPKIQVEYRDLNITTQALVGSAAVPTVGDSFVNLARRLLFLKLKTKELKILQGNNGVILPGHMTLLLGPPGSGKSSFLKALSGRLESSSNLKKSGEILYNGHTFDEFNVIRTSAYVGQIDNHVPQLTVYETLEFAQQCLVGLRPESYNFVRQIEEVVLKAGYQRSEEGSMITVGGQRQRERSLVKAVGSRSMLGRVPPIKSDKTDEDMLVSSQQALNISAPAGGSGAAALGRGLNRTHTTPAVRASHVPSLVVVGGDDNVNLRQRVKSAINPAGFIKGGGGLLGGGAASTDGFVEAEAEGAPMLHQQRTATMTAAEVPSDASDDGVAFLGDDEASFMSLLSEVKTVHGIMTLVYMRTLGIGHTKDTPVGDAMLRGVSGGERKRVTLAEMYLGERSALFLDEISTGLDSATLFNIISTLRRVVDTFKSTMIISLLQPPPEVFFAFQELMLMAQGRIVYHGPVGDAVAFFIKLGFVFPQRKDVPSFLQEVVTESGQLQYASDELLAAKGFHGREFPGGRKTWVIPIQELEAAFWLTPAGLKMKSLLARPFDKAISHPAALKRGGYPLSRWETVLIVGRRQWRLMLKDMDMYIGRFAQTIIVGFLIGSTFYQLQHESSQARQVFGVIFFMVMWASQGALSQLFPALSTKGVWQKMRDNQFYPAWAHVMTTALVSIPQMMIDAFIWSVLTYFMCGFYASASNFLTFYVIMLSAYIAFAAMFRTAAYIAPDGIIANTAGGILLLILSTFSGYTILQPDVPNWWIWAYYFSPYAWAMRSIGLNELTTPPWNEQDPTSPGLTKGVVSLETFGFFTDTSWIWAGVGFMLGTAIVIDIIGTLALQYLSGFSKVASIPDEALLEKARLAAAKRRAALVGLRAPLRASGSTNEVGQLRPASVGVAGEAQVQVEISSSVSIPFELVTLVWRDLRYFVPNPSFGKDSGAPSELELLKGITGFAEPGQLTALMGGSGAGKTTLMDCIAGRKTVGEIRGDIMVNGHPKVQATWSRVMGYVEQMDIHTPAQTVLEALVFSARLRLPNSTTKHEVQAYVDEVLELVDLTELMFDLVGLPGQSGLSVEQRKRLTIATEMVANPSVMFMDEPTSGLDARAAAIVMRAIRNVGRLNRTVVVTIHQPSIEIFESFDSLLLLQRGGRTTFFGLLGAQSSQLVNYLQAVPGCPKIKDGANPATWMLEVTGGAASISTKAVEVNWPDMYNLSELGQENAAKADKLVQRDGEAKLPLMVSGGMYAADFKTQVMSAGCVVGYESVEVIALTVKFNSAYWRMPSYNFVRYIVTIASALILGSIYFQKGVITGESVPFSNVQAVGGVIEGSTSFVGIQNMLAVMPLIGLERVVFYRERAASYYNPWAYGLVISLVELPYQIVQAIVFVCIFYPMLGFVMTAGHFFYYLCMVFCSLMYYVAFGQALMYVCSTEALAMVAGLGISFIFDMFDGYVVAYSAIPVYWQWMNRISPNNWVIYGLIVDQLGFRNELVSGLPGAAQAPTISAFLTSVFGYEYNFRFWCLLIILAYVLFYKVLGIVALRYVSFLKR
ncbi:hypothetical protein CEUSTIGMA_g1165.t1 [Chlamydomonas eustigma]|uniref:ABC transporter domain-containing protein n=1 Tax=Chlamydomonas eustigma TaxID=1157962 RepID=A0A250WSS9_9CHLO|nr:hypothetical protein CEUSTIGMA_g1165.t1 [Chlamydomonas eustigma]|eukprot:GAX73712.1 hypothetical protein CEUSTIGMA_g1165.t1 [Chlamydomonas eustigma]